MRILSSEMLAAVRPYMERVTTDVTLRVNVGDHQKKQELQEFLNDLASTSSRLKVEEAVLQNRDAGPLTFQVTARSKETKIYFSGVPGGHEFNSLILAILQVSGSDLKLDDSIEHYFHRVSMPLGFKVYVSLDCENCPDVVQTLNKFSVLSGLVSTETVDGGVFQDEVKALGIQGVPTVFLNGELFHVGRLNLAAIMGKLTSLFPFPETNFESDKTSGTFDIAIVGGGPAAISAAIYTARKGLDIVLIGEKLGGQVAETMDIENMISVPSTTGARLTNDLKEHVGQYSLKIREGVSVTKIEPGPVKTLALSTGEKLEATAVIIATGANWRELNIPGEKERIGSGVAYCPHCDGPFFKDKDIAVVGGGNSGIEAALDLSGIAKSVTLLEFMPELKADAILVDRAKQRANISLLTNVECLEVLSQSEKVSGLRYTDRDTLENIDLEVSGIFVQIGLIPNSTFLPTEIEVNEHGEIVVNQKGETSVDGIFACGDVTTVPYKQIVIAMGDGANVALATAEYVTSRQTVLEAV